MGSQLLSLIGCALSAGAVAGLADMGLAVLQGRTGGASFGAFLLAFSLGALLALLVFGPVSLVLAALPDRDRRRPGRALGRLVGIMALAPLAAPLGRALYKRLPWDTGDAAIAIALGLALVAGMGVLGEGLGRLLRSLAWTEGCLVFLRRAAIPLLVLALPAVFRIAPALAPMRASARGDLNGNNLLLLTIDTLRADALGAMGNPGARTPWLDALARRSTTYANCVSPSSWTLPSLGSLLTGTYPGEHRLLEDLSNVSSAVPALAEACRAGGLRTAAIVSNPWLATGALARGFDAFEVAERLECLWPMRGSRLYTFLSKAALRLGALDSAERLSANATSWIGSGRGAWFLWLHYFDPHLPNWPGPPWDRLYGAPPARVGSSVTVEEIRDGDVADEAGERDEVARLYAGEVARTDHGIGRVLRTVAADPNGTAIVFTVDHGEELWDHQGYGHGHTMFDELVRVPLFVSTPGAKRGDVVDRLVRLVDVAPTALDAAGLDPPADARFTGWSLLADAPVPTTYGEAVLYGAEQKYLRTDRWKLVFRPAAESDSLSLFDLAADPGERHDLAASMPAVRDSLFTLLGLWMERVGSSGAMAARNPERLDAATREQLRALGYLQQ